MSTPELVVTDDVPNEFCNRLIETVNACTGSGYFHLALCGGTTGKACYKRLAQGPYTRIDWSRMHIWWGDERCVAHHDPDSNYFMANEVVLKQLYSNGGDRRCLSPEFVHPMSCAANQPTSHRSPLCYQAQLEKLAASSLDLIHLGMGIDGHTASLFPDSEALEASPDVLVTFNRDPHNNSPHMRMTLTLSAIAKAKLAIVTVMGKDKHNTLKKLVNGANLPAGRIRAEKVVWIVDHDAAQDIDKF